MDARKDDFRSALDDVPGLDAAAVLEPEQILRLPRSVQLRFALMERVDTGAWRYHPFGRQNILGRKTYLVRSDDDAARILRLHAAWGRRIFWLAVVILFFLIVALIVPTTRVLILESLGKAFLPILVLSGGLTVAAPYAAAWLTLRSVGPVEPGPSRTWAEILRTQERFSGSTRGLMLTVVLFLIAATFGLWSALDAISRGAMADALAGLAIAMLAIVIAAIGPAVLRVRRLRVENERLETVVRERTDELRELNRTLEERVADQVRHIERLGQLKHFFSAPVAEMILDGKGFDPAKVHRRELTAVSVDLRGFTAFSETSEPEEVISVLRIYHAELGIQVNRCQATLEHFAGDGVMLFLNDPIEIDDHPARALELAVGLRTAMRPHLEEWKSNGFDIGLGIGIATGYATIGAVGYEGRWEYAAIGTVCNLAARLCAEAKDGQIVVSKRFLSRVGERADCEPLGERPLKGLSRPVAAFNVLGLRALQAAPA